MDEFTGWWLDEYDGPRFRKYVDKDGPEEHESDPLATAEGKCWMWVGARGHSGYGQFRMGKRMVPAHRVAWLDGGRKNAIPDEWVIDHLCRNTSCVNPQHLEPVPFEVNVERGKRGRPAVTHCPHGHEYSPENTSWGDRPNGSQFRECRTCKKRYGREAYVRKKEAATTSP